ncbi:QsdR family transcriptional regulator [Pseudonocardia sp. CA-107938]|uniref:QsdR family transcriptional regulator n=1 Tax=Pseudonocardia sp. CA-107938 TaxID=3240021 RepID=UPI003D8F0FB2
MTDRVVGPVVAGFTGTPLDRELALPRSAPGTGPLAAFRLARHHFLDGRRVDMGGLAAELQVNRVTLYRWVGRREDLLLRVLWSLTEQNLRTQWVVAAETGDTGRGRVAAIMARYIRDILSHAGFRTFLADEGDLAVRLLTVAERGFQPRLVRFVELLLREDVAAGVRDESVPPGDLAFAAALIVESFVYSTRITGDDPDPDRSIRLLNVLLR